MEGHVARQPRGSGGHDGFRRARHRLASSSSITLRNVASPTRQSGSCRDISTRADSAPSSSKGRLQREPSRVANNNNNRPRFCHGAGVHTPKQIAVDHRNSKLYFSDQGGRDCASCAATLDSSALETVGRRHRRLAEGIPTRPTRPDQLVRPASPSRPRPASSTGRGRRRGAAPPPKKRQGPHLPRQHGLLAGRGTPRAAATWTCCSGTCPSPSIWNIDLVVD